MNEQTPICPDCSSEYAYHDGSNYVCPDCGKEWDGTAEAEAEEETVETGLIVKDSNGAVLADGDTVTIIKDLPVKGASKPIKVGTKVKNIRLCDGDHNIDCKIPEFGSMKLKSEFVRKA